MEKVNILSFNMLASMLSKNPFEFESFQLEKDVDLNKNLKLLFDLWDGLFNPKAATRIDFTVKHFFKGKASQQVSQTAIHNLKTNMQNGGVELDRLDQLADMDVKDLIQLFDKANKKCLHKDWCLPTIDRGNKHNTFQKQEGKQDLEQIFSRLDLQESDQFQWLFDLMYRKTLIVFFDLTYFPNERLSSVNLKMTDEQQMVAIKMLPKCLIQNFEGADLMEDFGYSDELTLFLSEFFDNQNQQNTVEGKFRVIFDQLIENSIHFATLIEVHDSFQVQLDHLIKDSNQDYFPKNIQFNNSKDLLTLTVYDKRVIKEIEYQNENEDHRVKIVRFLTHSLYDKNPSIAPENWYTVAQCHLAAGDEFQEERLTQLESLFANVHVHSNFYICGDLNEHIGSDSVMIKKLMDLGFQIGEEEKARFKQQTCDKMRSSGQQQVNKMRKPDKSTKDLILGVNKVNDYQVIYQKISDHKMIVATITQESDTE